MTKGTNDQIVVLRCRVGSSVSSSRVGVLRRRWEEANKIIIGGGEEEEAELGRDTDDAIGYSRNFTSRKIQVNIVHCGASTQS